MHIEFRIAGAEVRPAALAFSLLNAVPDRPAGTQELCPLARLDDDVIKALGDIRSIETITGVIGSQSTGWGIVAIRHGTTAVVVALDLGDSAVKRWLDDAPSLGPMFGLWSPGAARVVRVPVTESIVAMRDRASGARPASPGEQRELLRQLLDHLDDEARRLPIGLVGSDLKHVYIALPLGVMGAGDLTAADDETLH